MSAGQQKSLMSSYKTLCCIMLEKGFQQVFKMYFNLKLMYINFNIKSVLGEIL